MGEGDLVLVPKQKPSEKTGYTTSLGSLESGRVATDVAVTTVRGERSRTKVVAVARATVRRSRRRGTNEGRGVATEEERRAAVGRSESSGIQTSIEWGGDAIGERCLDCWTYGK